jgi:hypothetical protein
MAAATPKAKIYLRLHYNSKARSINRESDIGGRYIQKLISGGLTPYLEPHGGIITMATPLEVCHWNSQLEVRPPVAEKRSLKAH